MTQDVFAQGYYQFSSGIALYEVRVYISWIQLIRDLAGLFSTNHNIP